MISRTLGRSAVLAVETRNANTNIEKNVLIILFFSFLPAEGFAFEDKIAF